MVYLGLGGADQMNAAIQQVAASTGKEYGSLFAGTTLIGIISTAAWGLGCSANHISWPVLWLLKALNLWFLHAVSV